MEGSMAIALLAMRSCYPRALQLMIGSRPASESSILLDSWTTLVSNRVIMFVEAANLIEILLRTSTPLENETSTIDLWAMSWCLMGMTGACLFITLGLLWKFWSRGPNFSFCLSRVERNPEIVGFLWLQVFSCLMTQSFLTASMSILIIWHTVTFVCIHHESSTAAKYRERYIEFWDKSPTCLLFLDGALEIVFRLKGLIPDKRRRRQSLLMAWPALCYA